MGLGDLNDWHLSVIPASTQKRTEMRFSQFCKDVSQKTGIHNGYELISSIGEREAKHNAADRNQVILSDSIMIGDVMDKNIVLVDDVYTTGNSFRTVAQILRQGGAQRIVGLFLAKTCWPSKP